MSQTRLGVRFVAVIALSLSIMAISGARSEAGEKELCPCLFDPAFWTQAAFMDELNSKDRAEENCSKVTLDRSSRMTFSLVGSKPLGLGMTLEVSRDMATDGFKAYSECKVSWTVTGSGGEGAAINFNEEILFDVTHYEVIAEPTSPYKDLISAMPSMNAGVPPINSVHLRNPWILGHCQSMSTMRTRTTNFCKNPRSLGQME